MNVPPVLLPYQSAELPPDRRTADLLDRMTLEEKAAQMMCVWQQKAETLVDASGAFDLYPAIFLCIVVGCLVFYRITKTLNIQIQDELAARRLALGNSPVTTMPA